MEIANIPNHGNPDGQVSFHRIDASDRARLSGPGLRTFRSIADHWSLSEKDRIAVLGMPARSTFHQWIKKAHGNEDLTLPFDTLIRISAVIGIYRALALIFEERAQALEWMKGPHQGTAFRGSSPMDVILEGTQDNLMTVRRYLDAWRGGHMGHGAPEGSFVRVTEDDLVFI